MWGIHLGDHEHMATKNNKPILLFKEDIGSLLNHIKIMPSIMQIFFLFLINFFTCLLSIIHGQWWPRSSPWWKKNAVEQRMMSSRPRPFIISVAWRTICSSALFISYNIIKATGRLMIICLHYWCVCGFFWLLDLFVQFAKYIRILNFHSHGQS